LNGLAGQEAIQILGQFLGAGIAPGGIFLQAAEADGLDILWHAAAEGPRWCRLALLDQLQGFQGRFTAEGGPAGQQLIENGSEAVNVCRRRERLAASGSLLGGHVSRCPQNGTRLRQQALPRDLLRQAKVGHHWHSRLELADGRLRLCGVRILKQNVCRLQIPVQDAALMRMMNGTGNAGKQSYHCPVAIVPLRIVLAVGNGSCQTATLDQFHAQEWQSFVLADLENRHNVGMIQPGCGLGLAAETLQIGGRGEWSGAQHFQGHDALEGDVPGAVHHSHAATGDFHEQLIRSNPTRQHRHRFQHFTHRGR
jgi:hypothetical protein